ncbi:MAG TPA: hypothetical protein VLH79_15390 [Chthonomonadales bacterium]|nr:hypothetical protein [Chthonomonadales bacterium]
MNLSGPADWNTELPFVDVFRFSRAWISQRDGSAWGQGPGLDLDERGWVRRLEPGCFAETPLCTIEGGRYPAGDYTVLYRGTGRLEAWGAATVKASSPGRLILSVDPSRGGFFLRLRETDPADPVRDIRCIMPGFEGTYREQPFHPAFLKRWSGIACLRFMDWMMTNGSRQSTWAERPRPDDATWTAKGVPIEVMVDLCNRLGADAWFCMPHLGDDDYVRQCARAVRRLLRPHLRVWVEYSNEVWNGIFEQSRWAGQEGVRLGLADKPWEAAWRYTALRSVRIFRIWEEEFGGREHLVRVLPSQAANPYIAEQVLGFRDAYRSADALAIAPYVSLNVAPDGQPGVAEVAGWSVDQVMDHMERVALPEAAGWITGNKKVADRFGLRLVAYEGGQHMVGVGGGENNETLTKLLHAANAHPRMGDLYRRHLSDWVRAGGGLFCHFSSVGAWTKWGSWGLLQHYDDPPESSPKFVATMEWARSLSQRVGGAANG